MGRLKGLIVLLPAAALLCAVNPARGNGSGHRLEVHGDVGYLNRAYRDYNYLDKSRITFPVALTSAGMEYQYTDPEGNHTGFGIASACIASGKKFNFNRYVTQPFTSVVMPYVFIGHDWGFWSLDLGVSWYFCLEKMEDREKLDAAGWEMTAEKAGMSLRRSGCYSLVNACFRLLPASGFHLKCGLGREDFHPVDSLLYGSLVFPWGFNSMELRVSFPTKTDLSPSANQTVSFRYMRFISPFFIGIRCGILIYNFRGHGGSVPLFNRLSTGLTAGISF